MTGRDVEQALRISHNERVKLTASKVLPPVGSAGQALLFDRETVEAVRELPYAKISHPSIAVRLGAPQAANDEASTRAGSQFRRDWRGWDETWANDTKAAAARMWWPVADPARLVNGTLLAVVSHVVVCEWRITDYFSDPETHRIAFEVEPPQHQFNRSVLRLGRGPLIKSW